MVVRRFLAWIQTAGAAERAEAAAALARAFLQAGAPGGLPVEETADAELALTAILDDPSPQVRRALAQELAASHAAPRHLIGALASDQSDVSAPVLNRSPLLGEAELIECARVADGYGQAAIALRPGLPAAVCNGLAQEAQREALVALAVNETAALGEAAMQAMLKRFGEDGELREALLARSQLPETVRCALVLETGKALQHFAVSCGWMAGERAERASREAREAGIIEIAAEAAASSGARAAAIVRYLRAESLLTPASLLRALLSGNRSLLTAALGELSGLPASRVEALTGAWSGPGFAALYDRAGLPASLLPAFRAALAAQDEYGLIYKPGQRPRLSHILTQRALAALEPLQIPDFASVIGLLRRFSAEAARDEARRLSESLILEVLEETQEIRQDIRQDIRQEIQQDIQQEVSLAPPVDNGALTIDLEAIEAEIAVAA